MKKKLFAFASYDLSCANPVNVSSMSNWQQIWSEHSSVSANRHQSRLHLAYVL